MVQAAQVQPVLETPAGVEAHTRVNAAGREVFILINHQRAKQTVALPWPADEHLRGQRVTDLIELAPYDVAVLTRTAQAKFDGTAIRADVGQIDRGVTSAGQETDGADGFE